jgi:urea transport system permease protein
LPWARSSCLLLALPLLSLLPADSACTCRPTLTLVGKILCYAIVALALDLVWGYAGILSLGHGLFFALGGYAMGMYLMRQAAGDGLPASWSSCLEGTALVLGGTDSFLWALCLVVLAPGLLAWCSASSPSARGSRACISRSSPRP